MKVENVPVDSIVPYEGNPRNNDSAVESVAASIKQFGFRQPIVVDAQRVIVVGHTRWKAAKLLGLKEVPVHVAADLTPEQARAYRLADNRIGEIAEWDTIRLRAEATEIGDDIDLRLFGFTDEEISFDGDPQFELVEQSIEPPGTYVWTLIGCKLPRFAEIQSVLDGIASIDGVFLKVTTNHTSPEQ